MNYDESNDRFIGCNQLHDKFILLTVDLTYSEEKITLQIISIHQI